jgi:flagellar assembly factor FliW
MLRCATGNFGVVEYDAASVIVFTRGLPGFESESLFVPLEPEISKPVRYLQSLVTPGLCFITLPVRLVDPAYELRISDEDLALIGVERGEIESLECLAMVSTAEDHPSVNLLGPLVINPGTRQAVQAVRDDTRYSVRHPLGGATGESRC